MKTYKFMVAISGHNPSWIMDANLAIRRAMKDKFEEFSPLQLTLTIKSGRFSPDLMPKKKTRKE